MLVTITLLSLSFGQALCTSYRVFSNLGVFPSFIIPPAQALLPFITPLPGQYCPSLLLLPGHYCPSFFPYPGIMSSYYPYDPYLGPTALYITLLSRHYCLIHLRALLLPYYPFPRVLLFTWYYHLITFFSSLGMMHLTEAHFRSHSAPMYHRHLIPSRITFLFHPYAFV
jgi:hypothetical protein